jgi:hypothetical protein
MTSPRAVRPFSSVALLFVPGLSFACSVTSVEEWAQYGIYLSRWYWVGTVLLGLLLVYLRRRRPGGWLTFGTVLMAAVFHPSWTVTPMWGPDCEHINVLASKGVAGVLAVMLIYQATKWFKHRPPSMRIGT